MITSIQWRYIKKWIIAIVAAEVIMLVLNGFLPMLYVTVAVLFFAGFILRVLRIYPGEDEPLVLDASAVIIALLLAYFAAGQRYSAWRFLLIFFSSVIIVPHLVYIVTDKKFQE